MTKEEFVAEEVGELEGRLKMHQNAIRHIQAKLDFLRTILEEEKAADGASRGRMPGEEKFWETVKRLKPARYKTEVPYETDHNYNIRP